MSERQAIPQALSSSQPPRRLEQVVRKALSSDPRMPIRLDRAAWKRHDPVSQDETEALVALNEAAQVSQALPASAIPVSPPVSGADAPEAPPPAPSAVPPPLPRGVPAVPALLPGAASWRTRALGGMLRLPGPALAAVVLMLLVAMAFCMAARG